MASRKSPSDARSKPRAEEVEAFRKAIDQALAEGSDGPAAQMAKAMASRAVRRHATAYNELCTDAVSLAAAHNRRDDRHLPPWQSLPPLP
jgi:hypothetical protein